MSSHSFNATQSWIIGSAPDCDLVLPQPSVSGHHCRLSKQGSEYWVEDLQSTNGTWVSGVRIPVGQRTPIDQGAPVTLGQRTRMPWPSGSGDAPTPAGSRIITIGRDPASDVQVDLPIVGWNHARIVFEDGRPILEDLNSRNGTSIDRVDNRIQRAALDPRSDVFLGSYKIAASQLLGSRKVEIGEAAFQKVGFRGQTMIVGRDPQSDLPLDYPMVSWRHARLTREANGILVEDLGSRNGTFVGGVRISSKVLIRPGQEIGLGSYRFLLLEGGELAQREYHGNLTIEAAGVVVNAPNGKRLIEPVSMTVFPSELVALMGGAGAGKTTLLKALNGYTKPAEGRVLFNGASLYDYYDRFRQQLGYVPQDDIVHAQLKVGEALYFSARLRTDLTDEEIRQRTVKVLGQLGMSDKIDTLIGSAENKTLSGGQRKRVNIALELINDTPVLFLDEPTSGLSSYDAESMIELLKDLSKQGKTIITTIHQPSVHIYKQFDDLIMVNRDPGGKTGSMVYFGPAYPDSIQFFNALPAGAAPTVDLSPEMLLSGVAKKSSLEWMQLFQASRYQRDFVEGRSGKQPATTEKAGGDKPRRHFDLTQWFALVKRNTIVKVRDRTQAAILLLQAPLFAMLISLVYWNLDGTAYPELGRKLAGIHFLMVVAAIWFGCNNAARDIVGEWTVYKRERMVTLKLTSYVFSKLAVLFALGIFQCFCLLGIVFLALHPRSNFFSDLLILVLSALVGTGLGLSISAFSRTTESAIALLPIVLLPIIALGGGMQPIYKLSPRVRWVANVVPSRWAFEADLLGEAGPHRWDDDRTQTTPSRPVARPASTTDACGNDLPLVIPKPDVIQFVIPHYLVDWKDSDGKVHSEIADYGKQTCKVVDGERYEAEDFRHPYSASLLVLLGMLCLSVLSVLGILLKRDSDPQ